MAWLMKQSTTRKWHLPLLAVDPRCRSRQEAIDADGPLTAEGREYQQKHGFLPFGIHAGGHEIPERFWPKQGYFINTFEKLPSMLGLAHFYLITEAWRDTIERFEPGVHQFKHVPLFRKDGSRLDEKFYAFNIRQAYHDVADRKRSTAPIKDFGSDKNVFINTSDSHNAKVYFRKKALGKYHLWRPREILLYNIAMSKELYSAMAEVGAMNSVRTLEIEEV